MQIQLMLFSHRKVIIFNKTNNANFVKNISLPYMKNKNLQGSEKFSFIFIGKTIKTIVFYFYSVKKCFILSIFNTYCLAIES